ncbi:hypothetical protein NDI76_09330 [Halogeometricum sp. S1BR25-6]|uniref:t-SNARE coiled-coil homology domain-containing protein n=1 Tax=Halogeometricum salsisoli TaxID=2950536 RepID=A0ABU2GDS8_9EURY|nr:hypothetical protein [Halogeometricum sp. S1BR25-6]MDS0298947.1 hypothetical protein [Halogeometricum sp. S1BR25-6]
MSRESDVGEPVSVSNGNVLVEKSFVADEFPVPAIKFRIVSDSEEPEHIRIVDQIPEEFPMEGIGFHPEYESDNWAAYKDHRVEYERTLDPNEEIITVYGVRLDELSEAEAFLVDPVLERPPVPEAGADHEDSGVEDILGEDRSQLVRDALQGHGSLADEEGRETVEATIGDAEAETKTEVPEAESTASASAADVESALGDREGAAAAADVAPRELAAETTPAITRVSDSNSNSAVDVAVETPADAERESDADARAAADATDDYVDIEASVGDDEAETAAADVDVGDATVDDGAAPGSFAAGLAAELRAGEVSEEDLDLLRSELDFGLPRSADVRIRRLQAQMDDLQAYSDALAEFIDEEGTGQDLVDGLRREVEALNEEIDTFSEDLAALDAEMTAADADRGDIREGVSALEGDLSALDQQVEDAAARLSDVDDRATEAVAGVEELSATLDEEMETVRADVAELSEDLSQTASATAGLDEELGDVREDIADLDGDVVAARESLSSDIEDLRSDLDELDEVKSRVDSIEDDIEVLMAFRERLNDAFGPGPGE